MATGELPRQLTSFVGRERELAELSGLAAEARLLTLIGAAGIGKTRLAVELAARAAPGHRDGARFVDLAPLAGGELVARAIAGAIGAIEPSEGSAVDAVVGALRGREMLLVLDSCEHVLEHVAATVGPLLRESDGVRILATSREALNVPGEIGWRVPPLTLPERGDPSLEELERSDAGRLFLERARRAAPDLVLTDSDAPAIRHICERLDGLPLALELAAVRARSIAPTDLLAHLHDRFRVLGDVRSGTDRHRTLRTAIDWSYDLLNDDERTAFRRTAIFAGSFDLTTAATVCADELISADGIAAIVPRLVERSMISRAVGPKQVSRYRLLDTMREYGRAKLAERGEVERLARRHADHYVALAEAAEPASFGPGQAQVLERLDSDYDDLRAALEDTSSADPAAALRLAGALGWYWLIRGQPSEGRRWLSPAIGRTAERTAIRSRALRWAASFARIQGEVALSQALLEEALSIDEELGDERAAASDLHRLGTALAAAGKDAAAAAAFARSLAAFERAGDPWGVAVVHFNLGIQRLFGRHLGDAKARLERALELTRQAGDRFYEAQALLTLAVTEAQLGDAVAARRAAIEGLRISSELGNRFGMPIGIEALAVAAASRGDPATAVLLGGAAASIRRILAVTMVPPFMRPIQATIEAARQALPPRIAEAQWERGLRMSVDDALAAAFGEGAPAPPPAGLTAREWEIARLVADGRTNREIAERLVLSERTVEGHVERVRGKLGFRSRAQIAAWVAAGALEPAGQVPAGGKSG